jgi:predicted component of type VI protein secretion system
MTRLDSPDSELIFQSLQAEAPCGLDLRYDPVFDRIAELARREPEGSSMGVWERENKKADWAGVAQLCHELLTTRTKDLQVAAWYGEALIHLNGLVGASQGWKMFCRLAMSFWPNIHPNIEDGDVELRLRPVYWFSKQTQQWMAELSLLKTGFIDPSDFSTCEPWEEQVALKSLQFELTQFESFLQQQFPDQGPFLHGLAEPVQQRLDVFGPEPSIASGSNGLTLNQDSGGQGKQRAFVSREAAYASIHEAAAYLRKAEPHSPVPMILDAIFEWRDCQFGELLERMPQDKASLYELLRFFRQS